MAESDAPTPMCATEVTSSALPELGYIGFNQDYKCLCVGTDDGYQIVDFDSGIMDELKKRCDNGTKNCVLVVRLYSSSFVAFVSKNSPKRLSVCNFKKDLHICSYTYVSSILNVLLNRDRLIVVCEDELNIHAVRDMKVIHTIRDTPLNPLGASALSNNSATCFLAYPGSNTSGTIQIFDAFSLESVTCINAHESPLQCMSFNNEGNKLATASIKGTIIRVFSVAEENRGAILFELRRGIYRCVTIYSLNFSIDSNFLCASSNTQTVHVFKLETLAPESEDASEASYVGSIYSSLSGAVSATAAYLPSRVTEMMIQERAFAWAYLPSDGKVTKAALTFTYRIPRLIVVTVDGMVRVFDFNPETGGECKLMRKHNLNQFAYIDAPDSAVGSAADNESDRVYAMEKGMQPPPLTTLSLEDPSEFPTV